MNKQDIDKANKAQLRKMCKQAGIKYGSLPVEGMRTLLRAKLNESNDYARERMSDAVPIHAVRKVAAPGVLDLLKLIPVGDSATVKEIAKRTGATEQSVRTIIRSCGSTAPSNARFHNTGLRFELKRGDDHFRRVGNGAHD